MELYAIKDMFYSSRNECLILLTAQSINDAINKAIERTDIADLIDESLIYATPLDLESDKEYIRIFDKEIHLV